MDMENTGRNRAYSRIMTWRKALRKRRIDRMRFKSEMYDNLHQYSKNKIHITDEKTDPNDIKSRKITEQRKLNDMAAQEKEANYND